MIPSITFSCSTQDSSAEVISKHSRAGRGFLGVPAELPLFATARDGVAFEFTDKRNNDSGTHIRAINGHANVRVLAAARLQGLLSLRCSCTFFAKASSVSADVLKKCLCIPHRCLQKDTCRSSLHCSRISAQLWLTRYGNSMGRHPLMPYNSLAPADAGMCYPALKIRLGMHAGSCNRISQAHACVC